jgi:hypothetical protein
MNRVLLVYALGVLCAALAGFLSPLPFLGFVPLAAGLVWAAYDLIDVDEEVAGGDAPRPPR